MRLFAIKTYLTKFFFVSSRVLQIENIIRLKNVECFKNKTLFPFLDNSFSQMSASFFFILSASHVEFHEYGKLILSFLANNLTTFIILSSLTKYAFCCHLP